MAIEGFKVCKCLHIWNNNLSTLDVSKNLELRYLGAGNNPISTVDVSNKGTMDGEEVVQLYIRDKAASVVRPVKELKGYQRVTLQPKETKEVTFTLSLDDLKYYDNQGAFSVEKGVFRVWIGQNSAEGLMTKFMYE